VKRFIINGFLLGKVVVVTNDYVRVTPESKRLCF